jgi:hypothetical protein
VLCEVDYFVLTWDSGEGYACCLFVSVGSCVCLLACLLACGSHLNQRENMNSFLPRLCVRYWCLWLVAALFEYRAFYDEQISSRKSVNTTTCFAFTCCTASVNVGIAAHLLGRVDLRCFSAVSKDYVSKSWGMMTSAIVSVTQCFDAKTSCRQSPVKINVATTTATTATSTATSNLHAQHRATTPTSFTSISHLHTASLLGGNTSSGTPLRIHIYTHSCSLDISSPRSWCQT